MCGKEEKVESRPLSSWLPTDPGGHCQCSPLFRAFQELTKQRMKDKHEAGKGLEAVELKYKIQSEKNKAPHSLVVGNPPLGFTLRATPANETCQP